MKSSEKLEKRHSKKPGGWVKILTVVALASTLNSCDDMSNNEIRLNPEDKSVRFKVEYQFYE